MSEPNPKRPGNHRRWNRGRRFKLNRADWSMHLEHRQRIRKTPHDTRQEMLSKRRALIAYFAKG